MHNKQIIFFIFYLGAANLQKSHLLSILQAKHHYIYKINSMIHSISNKLFNLLRLDKEFSKSNNIQLLLTMHNDLNNIAEEYFRIYDELRNIRWKYNKADKNNVEDILQAIEKEEIDKQKGIRGDLRTNGTVEYYAEHQYDSDLLKILNMWSTIEDFIDFTLSGKEKLMNNRVNNTLDSKYRSNQYMESPKTYKESETNETRRVYKGRKSRIKNFPFMASLHIMNEFMCAGSIISKDLVLTAASCLQTVYKNVKDSKTPHTIFVRIGSDYNKVSGELIPITDVIIHPTYDPITLKHNLALVRLHKKLKFSNKRVQRIKYDRSEHSVGVNDVMILGWGVTDANRKANDLQRLSVAHLDIYNKDDCQDVYSKYYVTQHNFCAGFMNKGGGACNGDVGGPAVKSGLLVGVISFGPTVCGTPDAPTVFTKISHYAEWIDNIIREKPNMRQYNLNAEKQLKQPQVLVVPILPIPPLVPITTTIRAKSSKYPREIRIMKKVLQEVILGNNSVIDYLLSGDMLQEISTTIPLSAKDVNYNPHMIPLANDKFTGDMKLVKPLRFNKIQEYEFKDLAKQIIGNQKRYVTSKRPLEYGGDDIDLTTSNSMLNNKDQSDFYDDESNGFFSYYEEGINIDMPTKRSFPFSGAITKSTTPETDKFSNLLKFADVNFNIEVKIKNSSQNPNKIESETHHYHHHNTTVELKVFEDKYKNFNIQSSNKEFTHKLLSTKKYNNRNDIQNLILSTQPWPMGVGVAISDDDFNYFDESKQNWKEYNEEYYERGRG